MTRTDPNTEAGGADETGVGSVFVSNYPPYSFWGSEAVPEAQAAIDAAPEAGRSLGLYLHIPFCRLRCKFCYYKVYTDKDNRQVKDYLDGMAHEVESYAGKRSVSGRPLEFIYFGGGTPSYLSSQDMRRLAERLRAAIPWDGSKEITFECEPGTLTRAKLETIRGIGVTRLSLGVEHFDDGILKENGRAHLSEEIYRTIPWIEALDFDQINVDLIAGMVGETWDTWRDAVKRTIDIAPDSVTVYQMELPYNTVYSKGLLDGSASVPLADWPLKREWHDYAFAELAAAGYEVSSAYTMVRKGKGSRFVYRDSLWHGTDMIGAGVSSYGHMGGVHYQNVGDWGKYLSEVGAGQLPLERAYRPTAKERLTRELILQLKLGVVDPEYFRDKFGADILETFRPAFERLQEREMLKTGDGRIELTRQGLLQVDLLLPEFYAPEYRNARYT